MYVYFKHNLALLKDLQEKALNSGQVSYAEELQTAITSFERLVRMS
jgi:hypothetical protein